MAAFDGDAELLQRSLQDISAFVAERDQLRAKQMPTGDVVGRIRSAMTKAEKLLERVQSAASRPDGGSSTMLCVGSPETARTRALQAAH